MLVGVHLDMQLCKNGTAVAWGTPPPRGNNTPDRSLDLQLTVEVEDLLSLTCWQKLLSTLSVQVVCLRVSTKEAGGLCPLLLMFMCMPHMLSKHSPTYEDGTLSPTAVL